MKITCIFTLLFFFPIVPSSFSKTIESICKKTVCRKAVTIKQPIDKESYQEFDIPKSPYVHKEMVNLVSGEVIYLSIKQKGGKITAIEYSKSPSDLKIEFKVKQDPEISSLLTIKNNTDKPIVYRARVNSPEGNWKYRVTSTCPVRANLMSFESWPFSISQPLLTNFRFAGPKDTACKAY